MEHLSSLFNGLARSLSVRKGKNCGIDVGREAAEAMAKEAKKNDLILRSPGIVNVDGSNNFASVFSKGGEKGVNQDCFIVWEEFGCQADMIFCGVFDGHGPWGHFVAKKVRESMPSSLLCNWQEIVDLTSLDPDYFDMESHKKQLHHPFDIWKESYVKTFAAIDQELERHPRIDSYYSGTTALTIVRQEFGCQADMIFCGVFDGHGPWGHFVAKKVRESMPSSLLCNWQEIVDLTSLDPDYFDMESHKKQLHHPFDIWKESYVKTFAAIDQELERHPRIDSYYSGTTALTIVRQGELIVIANVGDSRAVLATTSDDGSLVPVQLTVDFKPNLPQEAERITQCQGRVFCLKDEPGVHRVWLPYEETPGLAMSRAFGDYCVKNYGIISVPEVTQRNITSRDQFVVLATDGVWDVISNQEAVEMVSATPERAKSAKRLVECAVRAWKRKRRGIAMDDISAICLFFHPSSPHEPVDSISLQKTD